MELRERVLAGALGGAAGTLVLSGLREVWSRMGLVFETAPMQVVDRVEELGLVGDLSTRMHRALSVVAHCAYGVGAGAVLGLLRRQPGEATEEAAVGSALGVLVWGAGWSSWLPLAGVHQRVAAELAQVLAARARPCSVWSSLGHRLLGANP